MIVLAVSRCQLAFVTHNRRNILATRSPGEVGVFVGLIVLFDFLIKAPA